ncbi:hypothetical protein LCGC14_1613770, partial [marine sediment metagenome]
MALELQAGRGPKLTMGLPPVLGETPDKAVSFLRQAGGLLFKLKNADAYVRLEMGRQLLLIRGQKLWREMECRNYLDDSSPEGRPVWANEEARRYISWQDFLTNGFPIITGLQRRMGYICMTLADSEVLKRLGPRIKDFKSVQNAIIQTSDADCNEAGHRDRLAACLRGWPHVNPDPHALAWIGWHPCRIFLTVIHVDYVIAINALLFVSLVIG